METDSSLLKSEFAKASFVAEDWAERRFETTSHHLMKEKHKDLQRQRRQASELLKGNVAENYQIFVSASREIGNVEQDMHNVRNLLLELSSSVKALDRVRLDFGSQSTGNSVDRIADELQLDYAAKTALQAQVKQLEQTVEWLVEVPSLLDTLVAQGQFEEAVSVVERAEQTLREHPRLEAHAVRTGLRGEISDGAERLAQLLTRELQSPILHKGEIRRTIGFMLRLGRSDQAKSVFLATRSKHIKASIRKLAFQGEIRQYIGELARLVFSSIASTCDDFYHSFDANVMMSGFVVWTIKELEAFGAIFSRQVFGSDDFLLMGDCISLVKLHCRLLEEKGVYVDFYLDRMFHERLAAAVDASYADLDASLRKAIDNEAWTSSTQWVYDVADAGESKAQLRLTPSAKQLYALVQRYMENTTPITTFALSPLVASVFRRLFELYIAQLCAYAEERRADNQVLLAMLLNLVNIRDDLVPQCVRNYQRALHDRPLRDMHALRDVASAGFDRLVALFCKMRTETIVEKRLQWLQMVDDNAAYVVADTVDDGSLESLRVTPKIVTLCKYVADLYTSTRKVLQGGEHAHRLCATLLRTILRAIHKHEVFWARFAERVTRRGLHQFVLDFRFVCMAATRFASTVAAPTTALCEKAMRAYTKRHGDAPLELESATWFDARIVIAIESEAALGAILKAPADGDVKRSDSDVGGAHDDKNEKRAQRSGSDAAVEHDGAHDDDTYDDEDGSGALRHAGAASDTNLLASSPSNPSSMLVKSESKSRVAHKKRTRATRRKQARLRADSKRGADPMRMTKKERTLSRPMAVHDIDTMSDDSEVSISHSESVAARVRRKGRKK